MLRNQKSVDFAQSFVDQWLHIRDLGQAFQPDPKLFPEWKDSELQGDIKNQPVLFFREILANDLSILDLLDSKWTIATKKLQRVLYRTDIKPARPNNQEQPQRIELPEGSHRGGLLGMSAVLAISSHPHRTSPVLRGKWLLETILGTPPPPPPAECAKARRDNVRGGAGDTAREARPASRQPGVRELSQPDRPARVRAGEFRCTRALAHGRRGQADRRQGRVTGRHGIRGARPAQGRFDGVRRTYSSGISSTRCSGMRWGGGLTLQDSCTVDSIVAEVERNNYRAQALVNAVVMSVPFRYQGAPAAPAGTKQVSRGAAATGEEAMMIPRQKPLSRRTVLRGAGVALGLPWLEAMAPRSRSRACRHESRRCGWPCCTWPTVSTRRSGRRKDKGRDFVPLSDAQAAGGPEGPVTGCQQSMERGGEHGRRALHERVEPADVHHDH